MLPDCVAVPLPTQLLVAATNNRLPSVATATLNCYITPPASAGPFHSFLLQLPAGLAPSVRRALPPVGTHSTVLQLGHTTTVWLWLNTVVLQQAGQAHNVSADEQSCSKTHPRYNKGMTADDV